MKDFLAKWKKRFISAVEFIRDVRKELRNVSWPSRSELTGTTVVVLVAIFFFAFYLFVIDALVGTGMDHLFKRAPR
jgi:preprotein translocase subunit SecE